MIQRSSKHYSVAVPVPLLFRAALCLLVILAIMLLTRVSLLEDGYIYARYIRNDVAVVGLVFNIGERVNALTSPLYSYAALLLSFLLQGKVILATKILFFIFTGSACIAAEALFPWAGLLLASMPYMYVTVGMETSLFLFLIECVILLAWSGKVDWLPLTLMLVALTRFEGGAMTLPVLYWCYKNNRWPNWKSYSLPVLLLLIYLATNHHFYGSYIPASSSAKIGQGRSGFWGPWPRAFLYGYRLSIPERPSFITIFVVAAALPFAFRRLRSTPWNAIAFPTALILLGFYVFLNLPAYHWYYAPLILVLMLYGVAELTTTRVGTLIVAALVIMQTGESYRTLKNDPSTPSGYARAADWLNTNTAPNATVECLEIGAFGWELNRYLYDSLGLTLPKNADHIAHRDFSSWLEEDKPDYVLFHTTRPFPFEKVILQDPNYEPSGYNRADIMIYRRTRDFGRRGAPLIAVR